MCPLATRRETAQPTLVRYVRRADFGGQERGRWVAAMRPCFGTNNIAVQLKTCFLIHHQSRFPKPANTTAMTSPSRTARHISRLNEIRLPFRFSSEHHITPAADAPWTSLGSAQSALFPELEKLYWEGVKGELENIVRTLKAWQDPELANVTVEDEKDDFIHGFDTFIDQVVEESREFALRYGEIAHEFLHAFIN